MPLAGLAKRRSQQTIRWTKTVDRRWVELVGKPADIDGQWHKGKQSHFQVFVFPTNICDRQRNH